MTDKDALAKMQAKIQALLAHAKGTDNEAEAASYLAKAMALMEQHQIDIFDMVDAEDPIVHHVGLYRASSGAPWLWKLYSVIAKLYGCQSIHYDVTGVRYRALYREWLKGDRQNPVPKRVEWYEQRLVGRQSAIVTVDLMYPWIVQQVKAAGKKIAAEVGMSEAGASQRVGIALVHRVAHLIAEQRPKDVSTPSGRNAVMVLDQVKAKYEDLYPDARAMVRRGNRIDERSRDAANGIGLHRQTGNGATLKIGN